MRTYFNASLNYLLLVVVLLTPVLSRAVIVPNLYTAQLPVVSATANSNTTLLSQALQQVLIKVSGNSNAIKVPALANSLSQAESLVEQYTYVNASTGSNNPLVFQASFPVKTIDNLLASANQPVWSKDRPLVLAWIVLQDANGKQLIGSEDNSVAAQSLLQDAQQRGLPFMLPMLDLTDLQQINANQINTTNLSLIQQASTRYAPDAILIGQIDATNPQLIQASWTLINHNRQQQWQDSATSLNAGIQTAINELADNIAQQYAVVINNAANQITLNVSNLQGVTDYAKVLKYLRSLSMVNDVEVANVSATQASFNLQLQGSLSDLQQTIMLGNLLQPQTAAAQSDDQTLNYQFIGNNS